MEPKIIILPVGKGYSMKVTEHFHSDVASFEVEGISMVGNNRTGSLIGLTNAGKTFVDSILQAGTAEVSEELHPLYEALKKNHYFVDDFTKKNRITSAYLHVTDRCNLHCLGCYSYVKERNCRQDLTETKIYHILDELAGNGVKILVISGGEPFIRKDIASICRYAKNLGIKVQVITNGTMEKERYEKALPFIDSISVSVDGFQEDVHFIRDNGIMPQVLDTVRFLKERTDMVNLIFTLHKKNIAYMEQYVQLAKQLGTTFNFSMLTAAADNPVFQDYLLGNEEFEQMKAFLKKHHAHITDSPMDTDYLSCKSRCGAGKMMVSISADGTVYPCHMLHIPALQLGNVLKEPLSKIVFRNDNPFLNLDIHHIDGCQDCKYGYFCGGGCRARSYLASRNIYAKSDICDVSYQTLAVKFDRLKQAHGLSS